MRPWYRLGHLLGRGLKAEQVEVIRFSIDEYVKAEVGGGRGVGLGDMMGMEVLRDREADTYILYTNACCSCTAWPGNAIPIPDPRALHLANEPEVSVEGRERIVVEPASCFIAANLGLLAFGIGWFLDWLAALEMEA